MWMSDSALGARLSVERRFFGAELEEIAEREAEATDEAGIKKFAAGSAGGSAPDLRAR